VHLKQRSLVLQAIAGCTIVSGVSLAILTHLFGSTHQWLFFRSLHIPVIPLRSYLVLDRAILSKLTPIQKFSCVYCGYANALAAWMKDVMSAFDTALIAQAAHGKKQWSIITHLFALWFIIDWTFLALFAFAWMSIYQAIYFTIFDIPKASFSAFYGENRPHSITLKSLYVWERTYLRLSGPIQKWEKEVVNLTELYSCAIKHHVWKKGRSTKRVLRRMRSTRKKPPLLRHCLRASCSSLIQPNEFGKSTVC
jgi:hypothetical protein